MNTEKRLLQFEVKTELCNYEVEKELLQSSILSSTVTQFCQL